MLLCVVCTVTCCVGRTRIRLATAGGGGGTPALSDASAPVNSDELLRPVTLYRRTVAHELCPIIRCAVMRMLGGIEHERSPHARAILQRSLDAHHLLHVSNILEQSTQYSRPRLPLNPDLQFAHNTL